MNNKILFLIEVVLLLGILCSLGYFIYLVTTDGGKCVINPIAYAEKQMNESMFECGCINRYTNFKELPFKKLNYSGIGLEP